MKLGCNRVLFYITLVNVIVFAIQENYNFIQSRVVFDAFGQCKPKLTEVSLCKMLISYVYLKFINCKGKSFLPYKNKNF